MEIKVIKHQESVKKYIIRYIPLLITFTCDPGFIIAVWINHGSPKQTNISKTFEPTAFDIAMSPYLELEPILGSKNASLFSLYY